MRLLSPVAENSEQWPETTNRFTSQLYMRNANRSRPTVSESFHAMREIGEPTKNVRKSSANVRSSWEVMSTVAIFIFLLILIILVAMIIFK
ncbi:unnamed protein product [Tenebrio molitor]|nr:unnamed protein product [Tenebrio molitor]